MNKSLSFVVSSVLMFAAGSVSITPCEAASAEANAVDAHWLANAHLGIQAQEYLPKSASNKIIANNRKQNLRSEFDHAGVTVRDRLSQSVQLQMNLEQLGRDGQWHAVNKQAPKVHSNRVEFEFAGGREWFVNSEQGLEQGFDLFARPEGRGELLLHIDVDGANLSLHNGQVLLKTAQGQYAYDHLKAWDAHGRILPSKMRVQGDDIVLAINDAKAEYPITIDPLLTNVADTTIFSSQNSAQFGHAIANVGDVNGDGFEDVIITAYGYDGVVGNNEGAWFLYYGSATGMDATSDATRNGGQVDARLGSSVAGIGDVNGDGFADFAVGAEFFDAGQTDEGIVQIFLGGANIGASPAVHITLEGNQTSAFFGHALAGAGDVNGDGYSDVLVGANGHDGGVTNSGSAFLFFGGAGNFNAVVDFTLTSSAGDVRMGTSVAGVGDVNADGFDDLVIGAPEYESPTGPTEANEGAAFLYLGGSSFNVTTDFHFQVNQLEARVGSSVAGAGDVNGDGFADVLIGAPMHDGGATDSGSAFVVYGSAPPAFNAVAGLTLTSNQGGASFGANVAPAGDVNGDGYADVLVGATLFDNSHSNEGSASVFLGGVNPSTTPYKTIELDQIDAELGRSLAAADVNRDGYSDVLVGTPLHNGAGTDNGRVQLYLGGALHPDTTIEGQAFGAQASSQMGVSVAVGDVNGDGFADLVTGHNGHDDVATNSGRVSIFLGGPGGFNAVADDTISGLLGNERMGASVAVGDVNKDGYADILAGAPFANRGLPNEGAAYLFLSDAGVFGVVPDRIFESNQSDAQFGSSVALPGDIDGDGDNDIVIGAPLYDGTLIDVGGVYVFLNRPILSNTPDFIIAGVQGSEFLGGKVAGAGDVNGDGFADIMAGGVGFDGTGAQNAGVVRVFHGGDPFNTTVDLIKDGGAPNARFGSGIAGVGDVNADGFADVVMAAHEFSSGENLEGVAWLYPGSASGLNPTPTWRVESNQVDAGFGNSVTGAGDVNGDGFADFMVGAPDFDFLLNGNEGAVFLYYGQAAGRINPAPDLQLDVNTTSAAAGTSVAAGDFNGDGYSDLVFGAPSDDNAASLDEGSVNVYYANTTGRAQPLQTFDFVNLSLFAVDQWGVSAYGSYFTVGGEVIGSRGRENAKLQVQACPQGVAFGAPTCVDAITQNWTLLNANGQGTDLVAFPQVPYSLYHWRARALYLHQTGSNGALTQPTNPKVGPWRRLRANADLHDVRVTSSLFKDGFE